MLGLEAWPRPRGQKSRPWGSRPRLRGSRPRLEGPGLGLRPSGLVNIPAAKYRAFGHLLTVPVNLKKKKSLVQWSRLYQRRSNIRTGSAACFCIIGFLVIFLCIVAPPAAPRSGRVRFVFFYRASYVGLTSRQHLATVIRYADCVKEHFRASRRCQAENFTSFITGLYTDSGYIPN